MAFARPQARCSRTSEGCAGNSSVARAPLHYNGAAQQQRSGSASGGRPRGARFGTSRAQSWKTPTVAMESFPKLPHKLLTEEYRPRWGARSSKPSGGAKASPVGSTPASSAIPCVGQRPPRSANALYRFQKYDFLGCTIHNHPLTCVRDRAKFMVQF